MKQGMKNSNIVSIKKEYTDAIDADIQELG